MGKHVAAALVRNSEKGKITLNVVEPKDLAPVRRLSIVTSTSDAGSRQMIDS